MGKNSWLISLRAELDDAITYGSRRAALRTAGKGVKQACAKGLAGEIEYFQGQIEMLNDNFFTAIKHFDKAIELDRKDGAAYNDRALCMVELGIIDGAFVFFDKGIEVEPDYATVYHNKGWLLNNIGRHTEAVKCFQKALSLEPGRAVTYDNLADALFNLGDYRGAVKSYKRVLKLLGPGSCRQIQRNVVKQIKLIEAKILLPNQPWKVRKAE